MLRLVISIFLSYLVATLALPVSETNGPLGQVTNEAKITLAAAATSSTGSSTPAIGIIPSAPETKTNEYPKNGNTRHEGYRPTQAKINVAHRPLQLKPSESHLLTGYLNKIHQYIPYSTNSNHIKPEVITHSTASRPHLIRRGGKVHFQAPAEYEGHDDAFSNYEESVARQTASRGSDVQTANELKSGISRHHTQIKEMLTNLATRQDNVEDLLYQILRQVSGQSPPEPEL